MVNLVLIFLVSLCWGSFLNVLACRLLHGKKFFTSRSHCPTCGTTIAWYDNIPVISWFWLRGRCRACQQPISLLYPAIELVTALILTGLFYWVVMIPMDVSFFDHLHVTYVDSTKMLKYFLSYSLMVSALVAATRTDLESMLIPQLFTLWFAPVGVVLSLIGWLPLSWSESLLGIALGYGILWLIAFVFKVITKKDGLGIGDMELLAMIGSFIGPVGVWITLMIGSLSGLAIGTLYLAIGRHGRATRIPFGPFLALGALAYLFFKNTILSIVFGL